MKGYALLDDTNKVPGANLPVNNRIIASGSTTINAASSTTLTTQTRNAGELVKVLSFLTNDITSATWQEGAVLSGIVDDVQIAMQRTTTANEFAVLATNINAAVSRTIQWAIIGVTP